MLEGRRAQYLSAPGPPGRSTAEVHKLGLAWDQPPHTHPQEGGEALAVVPDGKVVWLGSEDFHDVFIELRLLDLKEENSQLITTPMCVEGPLSSGRPQSRRAPYTSTREPGAHICTSVEVSAIVTVQRVLCVCKFHIHGVNNRLQISENKSHNMSSPRKNPRI